MNCEEFEAVLSDYIDGEMSDQEASTMEKHAWICSACSETLNGVLQVRKTLSGLGAMSPPARFKLGLFGSLHEGIGRRCLWGRPLALSLAVVAALTVLLWPQEQEEAEPPIAWVTRAGIDGRLNLGNRDAAGTEAPVTRRPARFSQVEAQAVSF